MLYSYVMALLAIAVVFRNALELDSPVNPPHSGGYCLPTVDMVTWSD